MSDRPPPDRWRKALAALLRGFGRSIPDIPKVRALGNKLLWPLHRALRLGGGIVVVQGVRMHLDTDECVDRNLWFTPHLYDRQEIDFALTHLSGDGVFIDAGANIGYWSLRVASRHPGVRVVAVEANPGTARILEENIRLNRLANITVVGKGLAGKDGTLGLSCGTHGNRGGDSLKFRHALGTTIPVEVLALHSLCLALRIDRIGFLKLDIEGMEHEVLESFFMNRANGIRPSFICLETVHDPDTAKLLASHGYRLVRSYTHNSIFRDIGPAPAKG